MAQESNVIQVIIESVNKMSADLRRIDADMQKFQGTTKQVVATTDIATKSTANFHRTLAPMTRAVSSVTNAVAATNPEFRILIGNADNIAFSMARAAAGSATAGQAILNALKAAFNPATLIIMGAVTAIAYFLSKWKEMKDAVEAGEKAYDVLDIARSRLNATTSAGLIIAEREAKLEVIRKNINKEKLTDAEKMILADQASIVTGEAKMKLDELYKTTKESLIKPLRDENEQLELQTTFYKLSAIELGRLTDLMKIDQTLRHIGIMLGERELRQISDLIEKRGDLKKRIEEQTLAREYEKKRIEEFVKAQDQDLAEMAKVGQDIYDITKKAGEEAAKAADEYAKTFADRLVSAMEGEKMDIQGVFRSIGRVAMVGLIEELTKMAILGPLKQIFASEALSGGKSSGGIFGGIFKSIGALFGLGGLFGAGQGAMLPGNFVPIGPLRKFATGGMASGPTLGVIGEEGPEIVARMKPARAGDMDGGDIKQNIYLVDSRPPRLGPQDVVLYIAADMRAGGKTADAVQNVIKRT